MSSVISAAMPKPARLEHLPADCWSAITIGESGASVWRIVEPGPNLVLKAAPVLSANPIAAEAERLEWLNTVNFPAPKVLDMFQSDGFDWLVMTAVPGADLSNLANQPSDLVGVMANALRRLHGLDITTCPFDHRLPGRIEAAAANVNAGWVDETDFDYAHAGWRAAAVLDWVWQHQPLHHDLVVTHGDACLPNIMALDGDFSGLVDCGRLGVADRWQDLALACRSIAFNCGQQHVAPFLAAYGAEWDAERYLYYCALDEMF